MESYFWAHRILIPGNPTLSQVFGFIRLVICLEMREFKIDFYALTHVMAYKNQKMMYYESREVSVTSGMLAINRECSCNQDT